MDQESRRLDQDISEIAHTRLAIADKLEKLEHQVRETVEDTAMTIKDMVDHTKQTMDDTIQKTTQVLDPVYQVNQHPWFMLGGAVCVGYVLGLLETRLSDSRGGVYPYVPPGVRGASTMPSDRDGNDSAQRSGVYPYYPPEHERGSSAHSQPRQTSAWDSLSHEFADEVEQAKQVIVQAGRSLVHEFVRQVLPRLVRSFGIQSVDEASERYRSGRNDKSAHAS